MRRQSISVQTLYKNEYNKLINMGYEEGDASDTALDTVVLKLIKSITTAPAKSSVEEVTQILKTLPEKIDASCNNYAYIASKYLTYAIPSKRYLKKYYASDDEAILKGKETSKKILSVAKPPITIIHSLNPDIYYTDYECSFLAAIGPVIMGREFTGIRDIILDYWEIEISYIYAIDEYRNYRIEETLSAGYEQRDGYLHICAPMNRKSWIYSAKEKQEVVI